MVTAEAKKRRQPWAVIGLAANAAVLLLLGTPYKTAIFIARIVCVIGYAGAFYINVMNRNLPNTKSGLTQLDLR